MEIFRFKDIWFIFSILLIYLSKISISTTTWSYFRIGLVGSEFDYLQTEVTIIPENVTVEYVKISLSRITSLQHLVQATSHVSGLKLSAIAHRCDYDLIAVAAQLNLPYFIIGKDGACDRYTESMSNTFEMTISEAHAARSLASFFDFTGITKFALFIEEGDNSPVLSFMKGKEIEPISISPNATIDSLTRLIAKRRSDLITIKEFVIFANESRSAIQSKLLDAAIYQQLVRTGMTWYILYSNITESVITYYRPSGVTITTFQPIYGTFLDKEVIVRELARSAIEFFINVIGLTTPSNVVQALKQGSFVGNYSTIQFTSNGYFKNNSMLVTSTSKSLTLPLKYVWTFTGDIHPLQTLNTDEISNLWRVAVIPNTIFYNKTSNGEQGIAIDVLKAIQERDATLTYVIVEPPDGYYGSLGSDGQWNGLIKLLVDNEADVILMDLTMDTLRAEVVTFSVTISDSGFGLLYQNQNQTIITRMIWYLTVPFSINVWILLIICYFLLSFVLWITDIISPNKSKTSSAFTWGQSCFVVFAAFVMAKLELAPRMLSVRIFVLLLWFATLIFVATYTAMIYPLLLTRPKHIPIKTLGELYDSGMNYAFTKGTASYTHFENFAVKDSESAEGRLFLKNNASISRNNISETVKSDTNFAYIGGINWIRYEAYRDCSLTHVTISKSTSNAFALRKNWKFKEAAQARLVALKTSGRLNSIYGRWFGHNRCQSHTAQVRAIDWNDVVGLVVLLGVGCVLAFISAMVELFYKKCVLCVQRYKGTVLKFGAVYSAKVQLVENEGIWFILKNHAQEYHMPCQNLFPSRDKKIAPADLGINVGNKMRVKYFGNDPITGERTFTRAT